MKKKQVVVDLFSLRNPNCGLGQVTKNYIKQISETIVDDIDFTLIVPTDYDVKSVERMGVRCVKYYALYKFLPMLLPKVDLWHSTDQFYRIRRHDAPQILTLHDLNFLHEKSSAKAERKLKRMQQRVDNCSTLAVISQYVAEDVKQHIDLRRKKPLVIYNGVENISEAPEAKPDFIKNDRPFFFTIGQVRRKKNFHTLVPIMQRFENHDLYICGQNDGEYADEIRSAAQSDRLNNVFLPGTLTQKEKVWMYRHCDAFLFPSLLEGFGLPVIEAMQFGKPVFTSNCTSIPEVAGGYSFIWEDFEPSHMAELMTRELPSFKEKRTFADDMVRYATTNFTYKKNFENYLALYRQMLGIF